MALPQNLQDGLFDVTVLETTLGTLLVGAIVTLSWADLAEVRLLSGGSNLAVSPCVVEKEVLPVVMRRNSLQPKTDKKRKIGVTKSSRKKRRKGRTSSTSLLSRNKNNSLLDSPSADILNEFHDLLHQRKIDLLNT